jgi:hypothetical protein
MLNEAVEMIGTLRERAMPDEWRAAALNNLGLALRARFELAGDREDLRASLKAQREALEFTAADAAERVNRLNNLTNTCWALYLSTGVLADLDEAVDIYAAAAECPNRPVIRAACLLGLGTARWDRWGRRQMPGDLDAAIVAFTSAVEHSWPTEGGNHDHSSTLTSEDASLGRIQRFRRAWGRGPVHARSGENTSGN